MSATVALDAAAAPLADGSVDDVLATVVLRSDPWSVGPCVAGIGVR